MTVKPDTTYEITVPLLTKGQVNNANVFMVCGLLQALTFYPLSDPVTPDYNDTFDSAVQAFQVANGITPATHFGFQSWQAIVDQTWP